MPYTKIGPNQYRHKGHIYTLAQIQAIEANKRRQRARKRAGRRKA